MRILGTQLADILSEYKKTSYRSRDHGRYSTLQRDHRPGVREDLPHPQAVVPVGIPDKEQRSWPLFNIPERSSPRRSRRPAASSSCGTFEERIARKTQKVPAAAVTGTSLFRSIVSTGFYVPFNSSSSSRMISSPSPTPLPVATVPHWRSRSSGT